MLEPIYVLNTFWLQIFNSSFIPNYKLVYITLFLEIVLEMLLFNFFNLR